MDTDTEHLKRKAEIFLRNDIRVFIKDIYDNYHFCNISELGKDWVIIKDFKGNMVGKIKRILWIDIVRLEEYREELK